MLIGKFELNPKRRPIWAWLKLYLTSKRITTRIGYITSYCLGKEPVLVDGTRQSGGNHAKKWI